MKNWLVERNDDGSFHIIKSTDMPSSSEYFVHCCTEHDDIDKVDVVDNYDIDGILIGKKTVLNQTKKDDKESAVAAQIALEKAEISNYESSIASLRAIDWSTASDVQVREAIDFIINKKI